MGIKKTAIAGLKAFGDGAVDNTRSILSLMSNLRPDMVSPQLAALLEVAQTTKRFGDVTKGFDKLADALKKGDISKQNVKNIVNVLSALTKAIALFAIINGIPKNSSLVIASGAVKVAAELVEIGIDWNVHTKSEHLSESKDKLNLRVQNSLKMAMTLIVAYGLIAQAPGFQNMISETNVMHRFLRHAVLMDVLGVAYSGVRFADEFAEHSHKLETSA